MEPLKSNDPSILGDWRIMGRLGQGGFGTVFLAEKGAQKAAIKVIKSEFVEENDARARLTTEAEVLSKLSNPFIGKILDADLKGELPWIATEFINGPTLDNKVKYEGPLEEIEWFNLAANLFHAIVAANELGVIHKDIKPSNIILGEMGNKLIDFGIAHIEGRTKTVAFGDREGSTPFSSPEHFTPRSNPKMDVFSAAATLAFAGKGSGIWVGENDLQLMRSINDDEPNLDGLTENQINFLKPLFEKNPSDRPTSNEAMTQALAFIEFFLGSASKPEITKSKPKRGRSVLARALQMSVVSVLLLIIGLGVNSSDAGFRKLGTLNPFSQEKDLITACKTNLQFGSLDKAIESCDIAVKSGLDEAKVFLARAYKAQGSSSEAERVLVECKDNQTACKSDYAYFFQTDNEAIDSLKVAYEAGDQEAAWRIGNLYLKKKFNTTALSWFEKGAEKQNPISNILLANYWAGSPQNDYPKAIKYSKLAANLDLSALPNLLTIKNPVERLVVSLYEKAKEDNGKIEYLKNCGEMKILYCISTLAETYLFQKDFVLAKKWGLTGANLKDARSMWVLARVAANKNSLLPEGTVDKAIDAEIFDWYKKAAELGDVKSAFALGFGYTIGMGSLPTDLTKSCYWYQKTMTGITDRKDTYEEEMSDIEDYAQAAQFFELQSCQTILLGGTPALRLTSPNPSPTKASTKPASPKVTATPANDPSPILNSESFKLSAPIATNSIKDSIFGRAFIDGMKFWRIPLTNSKTEKVPGVTAIQFRIIGYESAGWMDVPYKLKIDSTIGSVYAEVDDMTFAVIFKNVKYCPEFRVVREENGKIVHIWDNGQPDCATDYNP